MPTTLKALARENGGQRCAELAEAYDRNLHPAELCLSIHVFGNRDAGRGEPGQYRRPIQCRRGGARVAAEKQHRRSHRRARRRQRFDADYNDAPMFPASASNVHCSACPVTIVPLASKSARSFSGCTIEISRDGLTPSLICATWNSDAIHRTARMGSLYLFSVFGTTNRKVVEICAATGSSATLQIDHQSWMARVSAGRKRGSRCSRQAVLCDGQEHWIAPPSSSTHGLQPTM